MENDLDPLNLMPKPTPNRPLLGLTILIVEDSRFSCEAMRFMALRSGARLRRADSIQSAKRHLRVYMPSVIIVDVGLPDGSGLDLIRELSNTRPRVAALIGTSGDELHHTATLKAGADVFISKPYESLASFQQTLLNLFPGSEPLGLRLVSNDMVHPDPAALRDDLYHAKSLIEHEPNKPMCDYLRQFLTGVAKSVGDTHLERAAQNEPIEDLGVIIDQKIREVRIFQRSCIGSDWASTNRVRLRRLSF